MTSKSISIPVRESKVISKWLLMMVEICDIYTAYNEDVPVAQVIGSERGLGGGGGSTCRLSVKISLLCRLSVKIFTLCRLSVNLS